MRGYHQFMQKVLLVIDEFNELEAMESLFKRLGFDVLALGKESLVADALLGFHPELALISFKARNVDGVRLATKLKTLKPTAAQVSIKVALVWATGMPAPKMNPESAWIVDAMVEVPLKPVLVIQMVSRLLNIPEYQLMKKYERAAAQSTSASAQAGVATVTEVPAAPRAVQEDGTPIPSHPSEKESLKRSERYAEFLRVHPDEVDKVLPREKMQSEIRKVKASETPETKAEVEDINAEKRAFTVSLFKKK